MRYFLEMKKYNDGFLKVCRNSNNLFILLSLVEWQINFGQSLITYFVDFAKAFDRNILFQMIIKPGLHGHVVDTLRDIYI